MKIYAVEWCFCSYESGFDVESLHLTKAGAYKAMRKSNMVPIFHDHEAKDIASMRR